MTGCCPHCGATAGAGRFCDQCAHSLQATCHACGSENRPTARFCGECGTSLQSPPTAAPPPPPAPSAQHKQVTILFADICGSTQLIGTMDPEQAKDTLAPVMATICEAVARFGGVVNHRMGDGVMALFGAPVSAEDHAARACFAALAALDDVGRMGAAALPVRAGISSGPIILYRTGRDDDDYGVAGVTAHLASRLEQSAEPGAVLLCAQTADLVRDIARLEPLPALSLKGITGEVRAFRLLGAVDRPSWMQRSAARSLSPFMGRDDEMRQLHAVLGRADAGFGQALALVGDAGAGKSRLIHEMIAQAPAGRWHVARIETTTRALAIPYLLVTALLHDVFGCGPADAPAIVAERFAKGLASLGLDPSYDVSPLLIHLKSGPMRPSGDQSAAEPAMHQTRLIACLRPILHRIAVRSGLLLVIEDYHWLDRSSAELLGGLLAGLPKQPEPGRFLLLLTTRPERRPGWPLHMQHAPAQPGVLTFAELEVGQLGPIQSDALLRALIGDADALGPLRAEIVTRADGTPLFLEEFARSLHESGALAGGTVPSNIVIPASVQAILAARIDRQPDLPRRLLQIASVIGRTVQIDLLEAVAGVEPALLAQALDTLRDARFVDDLGPDEGSCCFSHALTQAVAYDTVLRSDRRVLHGRVLHALETQHGTHAEPAIDQLTHHALCAEAWPQAARYALEAGQRASRRAAMTEARAYLEAALGALEHQPVTIATVTIGIDARLALRGIGMNHSAGHKESLERYLTEADQLAERAGDRVGMARVAISRGAILAHWGDLPGAKEVSRTALRHARTLEDTISIVGAAFALAQAHWYAGELDQARTVLTAHLPYARHPDGQARGAATLVLPAAAFFSYLARIEAERGRPDAARAALAEGRAAVDRHGHAFDETLVDIYEGWLLIYAGQAPAARALLERALRVTRENGFEWHLPSVACALGRAYVDTGCPDLALPLLQEGAALADQNWHIGKRLLCNPMLLRVLPNLEDATALGASTVRQAAAGGYRPVIVQTDIALGRRLMAAGITVQGRTVLRQAWSLATELGLVHEAAQAAKLL